MSNFIEPFIIESGALGDEIGAVLTQQGRLNAIMSWALGISKLLWSTYAKEMLVIIQAIRTWWPDSLLRKFYIQTDKSCFKYLFEQHMVMLEQQKWVAKLHGYDYEVLYMPWRENLAADATLTNGGQSNTPTFNALFVSPAQIWEDIKGAAIGDAYMEKIGKLATDKPGSPWPLPMA